MRRSTAVPVVALVAALVPVAPAVAALPSLAGELLTPTEQLQATRACDANGTSTISYSISGIAAGPYPGTFTESGSLSIGSPQTLPVVLPGSLFVDAAGPVTIFQAQFTIDSPVGRVTGTKTLPVPDPTDQGSCVIAPTAIADIGFGPELCTDVDNATARMPTAHYDATIQTATETQHDSGGSVVFVSQFRATCTEFSPNQTSFQEEFYATQPVNTPGQATGGGTIGPAPLAGAAFGFQANSAGDTFTGDCTVLDHDTGTEVKCVDVTGFAQEGNTVEFTGDAEVNGIGTTYRIVAQDNGEPNSGLDTFSIETGLGYSRGGSVTDGDVQTH
jgi:hypothetical protein